MLTLIRRPRRYRRFLSPLLTAAVLMGCASARTNENDGSYVYRSDADYVRLEPLEAGAVANSHPFTISAVQLRELLAPLKVSRARSIGRAPIFGNDELDTIAAPLASALAKAGPNQDVVFGVTSYRGILGRLSPKSMTTGRLFVTGDTINLIFGLMQQQLETEKVDPTVAVAQRILPATRAPRIDTAGWEIDPVGGYFHDRRGDWVTFDRASLPAPTAPAAAPPASTADSKAEEIEKRLQVLDALRKKGAITEQEYLERRRAILEQL